MDLTTEQGDLERYPISIQFGHPATLPRPWERRSRAHTTSQQALRRARIILLAADGVPNRQIATQVGIGPDAVATWRRRFASERLKGLQDRRRPGRPRVYDHDVRLKIVATSLPSSPASTAIGRPGLSPSTWRRSITSRFRRPGRANPG
jgi:hypothetical protein